MNKLLIAAVLAATFGCAQADNNLVVDGSFEAQSQAAGSWSVYASVPGWTTTAGPGIEIRNAVAGTAFDGANFVELDSYGNSAMAQSLLTDAGASYTLSFAYSGRSGVDAGSNPIQVAWNGVALGTVTADGSGNRDNAWQLFSYGVVCNGHDTLSFRAIGRSDSLGGSLDAVAVHAVPEPATWALMLGGVALIALSLGRRRAD